MANIRIEVRGVIRRAAEDLYIARCVDYDVIARGATPSEAAQKLLEVFLGTFEGYRRKGRNMFDLHPKAPSALLRIFESAVFSAELPPANLNSEEFRPRFRLDEQRSDQELCSA